MGYAKKKFLYRTKQFVRKQERAIAIVGALIVFLTFLTKEVLRDRYKDIVSSINSAEGMFSIRDDQLAMRTDLWNFERRTEFQHVDTSSPTRSPSKARLEAESSEYLNRVRYEEYQIELLKELSGKLPVSKRMDTELNEREGDRQKLAKELEDLKRRISSAPEPVAPKKGSGKKEEDKFEYDQETLTDIFDDLRYPGFILFMLDKKLFDSRTLF